MCGGDLVRSSNANALNLLSNTEEKYHGLGLCEWCWYMGKLKDWKEK